MNRTLKLLFSLLLTTFLIIAGCGKNGDQASSADQRKINSAVDEMLQGMSLEEKVGQVIIGFFNGPEFSSGLAEELQDIPLGGVVFFNITGNIENAAQVAALTEQIQQFTLARSGVPLFIAVDQEGGIVARLTNGVTVFPGNMALGAAGSEDLARLNAAVCARELRILGFNLNLAPVVDVNNNPANPVIGIRSFGSDPAAVARLGAAMVAPYREEGVLATAKHFPGHGDTDIDSHYGLPRISHDLSYLSKIELLPFQTVIDADIPAVMLAHILAPQLTGSDILPVTLSPRAIRYLREEMGFDGLILSDSMSMGAICNHWGLEEASVMAFQAGVDLILIGPGSGVEPGDRKRIFLALMKAVENGTIPTERLEQSVRRILTAKIKYDIIADPWPRTESLSLLASPENLDVALHIARESVTLVRDRSGVIPLYPEELIPVIWPTERERSLALLTKECPYLQPSLLSFGASPAEATALLESVSVSSLVLVGTYNLRQYPVWVDLINALTEKTEVTVIAMASPYDLLAVPRVGTYLALYSDCSASVTALAEILQGSLVPRGRLPVELPGLAYE